MSFVPPPHEHGQQAGYGIPETVQPVGVPDAGTPPTVASTNWKSLLGAVAVDALPPLALFFVLQAVGVPSVLAYTLSAVIPLVRLIVDRLRGQSFNVISGLVGLFLVVSILLAFITNDVRAVMARGCIIYAALAIALGISLFTRRPLMFLLMRYVTGRTDPAAADGLDQRYQHDRRYRTTMRIITAVWAVAFGGVGVACGVVAFTLPIALAAIINNLLEPVVAVVMAVWTGSFLRRRTVQNAR